MNPTTFSEALLVTRRLKQFGFAVQTYNDRPDVFIVYRNNTRYEFTDTSQILDFLLGVEAQQASILKSNDEKKAQLHTAIGKVLHRMDWTGVREVTECQKKT